MKGAEKRYNGFYENNYSKLGISYREKSHLPYENEPKQVNIRIGISEYEKLEASRKKMGLSKSEYLMKLINENYEG